MKHVVMFSGGVGSWATARRVASRRGIDDLTLLFADTLVEDADTYRFLHDAAENIGAPLVKLADGRTPFEVFHDDHFLGNQRLANCSKYLKQKPCRDWLEASRDPDDTMLYVGIDWTETHRIPAIEHAYAHGVLDQCLAVHGEDCPSGCAKWEHCTPSDPCSNRLSAPWVVSTPMAERPYVDKRGMLTTAKAEGLRPPAAYDAGFPHSNCLEQGCVRGGQAYWRHLLRIRPAVYHRTEQAEQEIRATDWGADAAMLRDRTGGTTDPMTLREFRERSERQPELIDADEWGACACF